MGCPSNISGDFSFRNNKLTSLEGSPTTVGGNFSCADNQLTSLEGAPNSVGGNFYCRNNKLIDFIGINYIGGSFYCVGNPVNNLFNLFIDESKIELFNYMDPVRPAENEGEEPILYLILINEFLKQISKNPITITNIKGYNCQ